MKSCVVLLCIVSVSFAADKYSSRLDSIDVEEVAQNERLLRAYADCFVNKGPCTKEGKEIKDIIQEALETGCEKCTDPQLDKLTYIVDYVVKEKPEIWNEITIVYDPEGKWKKKYEDIAKEKGIILP